MRGLKPEKVTVCAAPAVVQASGAAAWRVDQSALDRLRGSLAVGLAASRVAGDRARERAPCVVLALLAGAAGHARTCATCAGACGARPALPST